MIILIRWFNYIKIIRTYSRLLKEFTRGKFH